MQTDEAASEVGVPVLDRRHATVEPGTFPREVTGEAHGLSAQPEAQVHGT